MSTHPSAVVTQFYNFLCSGAIEVDDKWRHNDVTVDKVINIDQNSRSQTATEALWSVSKLSTESVGSRHELVCEFCSHTDADATQLDRPGLILTDDVISSSSFTPITEYRMLVIVNAIIRSVSTWIVWLQYHAVYRPFDNHFTLSTSRIRIA